MKNPTSFHACVADDAISKVSRLFNATLDDIFAELFQNARRAGATQISVSQIDYPDLGPVICLIDNGPGLSDPRDLFTLGQSAWENDVQSIEDAAGMGFFSLAGRRVRIIAQKHGTCRSWMIDAEPESFGGEVPITCSEGPPNHDGTTILIAIKPNESFVPAANHAARYLPIDVMIDGVIASRKDFLADAEYIEEWNGIRIGIYESSTVGFRNSEIINFHGVTLHARLPSLSQEFHRTYYARLDVTHCASLKLVLPARKEIVENAFMDDLRNHISLLFYQLIKEAGAHSLSYDNFRRAAALGIDLLPAAMMLREFKPSHADRDQTSLGAVKTITADDVIYDSEGGAIEEQNLAYALSAQRVETRLYDPKPAFTGYEWYEQLTRLSVKEYRVIGDTDTFCVAPGKRLTMTERPDQLEIQCILADATYSEAWTLATDWLIFGEDDWGLDDVDIAVTKSSKATSADLVDFLEHALFCPSDDAEAGSYDQQERWFRDEAEDLAINMLETSLDAEINAITRVIDRELYWLRRQDQIITVEIGKGRIDVSGLNPQPVAATE
ncbi:MULTISPECIES: ATP-binding protein [Rhodobacterales]|uniref:ATP-binding protein n=1 Tax=Pelagivirga sediminicola TaxID=2170575 RepID=A0A2T7G3Q5_9RHOB|nr:MULTISPECIES: ATP-binding protein [Rhodobacterales]MCQ0090364.1 ATP-binding protein [Roseovarius sp. M141]PVA09036.1 hypothetical protein DC366_15875 [Pelagivirga sediminicola]